MHACDLHSKQKQKLDIQLNNKEMLYVKVYIYNACYNVYKMTEIDIMHASHKAKTYILQWTLQVPSYRLLPTFLFIQNYSED